MLDNDPDEKLHLVLVI